MLQFVNLLVYYAFYIRYALFAPSAVTEHASQNEISVD